MLLGYLKKTPFLGLDKNTWSEIHTKTWILQGYLESLSILITALQSYDLMKELTNVT